MSKVSLKYLRPEQYASWIRKIDDGDWVNHRYRDKKDNQMASAIRELRDAFAALAEKDAEIERLKEEVEHFKSAYERKLKDEDKALSAALTVIEERDYFKDRYDSALKAEREWLPRLDIAERALQIASDHLDVGDGTKPLWIESLKRTAAAQLAAERKVQE